MLNIILLSNAITLMLTALFVFGVALADLMGGDDDNPVVKMLIVSAMLTVALSLGNVYMLGVLNG